MDISLLGLDKVAVRFIEKVSDAAGVIYEPTRITRKAKAEAKAALIRADSQITVDDLQRRAATRVVWEETQRQANMEAIIEKSLPLLEQNSSPEGMDNDWVANFFDKCRLFSDEEVQQLWAFVLSGEANSPGTFSRQTVNILANLDEDHIKLFEALSNFTWYISDYPIPLVFDLSHTIYTKPTVDAEEIIGINHGIAMELDNVGLVRYTDNVGLVRYTDVVFNLIKSQENMTASYWGQSYRLTPPNVYSQLNVGNVLFTLAGAQLLALCTPKPVDGYCEYVLKEWGKQNFAITPTGEGP